MNYLKSLVNNFSAVYYLAFVYRKILRALGANLLNRNLDHRNEDAMLSPVRIQSIITLLLAMGLLALASGCAVQTNFSAVDPASPDAIKTNNYLQVRSVTLEGRLQKHASTGDLIAPLISGFAVASDELKAKRDAKYADAILDVQLNSSISTRNVDKIKNIPALGTFVMMYSGNSITYDWTTGVNYTLASSDDTPIISGSFQIKGQDTFTPNTFATSSSVYTGASVLKLFYELKLIYQIFLLKCCVLRLIENFLESI